MRDHAIMAIVLTSLILPAAAIVVAAPEAAITTLAFAAAGLGIALHAVLPPPAEDTTEAVLIAAMAAM